MSKTFTWIHKAKWLLGCGTYSVFLDNVLFAEISDTSFEKTNLINGYKFKATAFSPAQYSLEKCYLINPDTREKYCCIEMLRSPGSRYSTFTAVLPNKTVYKIDVADTDSPAQNNGQAIQKYDDQMFFAKSGKLEVRSDKDIELLIACLFFVLDIRVSERNSPL